MICLGIEAGQNNKFLDKFTYRGRIK